MNQENININLSDKNIAVISTDWNNFITDKMRDAAVMTLAAAINKDNIYEERVPGAFELPLACRMAANSESFDAVVALGCVIRGETPHFDYISSECSSGIMRVMLDYNIPIGFGVLTTDNREQAEARAGGKKGNKGTEAAETIIKMLNFQKNITV